MTDLTEQLKLAIEKNKEEWTDLSALHEALIELVNVVDKATDGITTLPTEDEIDEQVRALGKLEAALKEMGV